MAEKSKTKEPKKQEPSNRSLDARPPLPEAFQKRLVEIKKNAENRIFLSWDEGDTAACELLNREVIKTRNGDNPAWTARYHEGNLHGTGGGAPERKGQVFRFWEPTVLKSKLQEINAGPGSQVVILCLGDKEGQSHSYKDFVVEALTFEPLGGSKIQADES